MLPFKMAEDAEMKTPSSVNTEEADDLTTATVKMEIPGFQVQSGIFAKPKPKAGKSNADVKYESMSLELSADVTAGSKTTKYFYKVNKLPGEIDPDKSTVEYHTSATPFTVWNNSIYQLVVKTTSKRFLVKADLLLHPKPELGLACHLEHRRPSADRVAAALGVREYLRYVSLTRVDETVVISHVQNGHNNYTLYTHCQLKLPGVFLLLHFHSGDRLAHLRHADVAVHRPRDGFLHSLLLRVLHVQLAPEADSCRRHFLRKPQFELHVEALAVALSNAGGCGADGGPLR
ncbi:hypothetical protein MAR_010234, partial [Mya arenaria]